MRSNTTRRRPTNVSRLLALGATFAVPCLVVAGCTTPDASRAPAVDAASAAPPVPAEAPTESPGSDEIHPVYPVDAGPPDPLAQRFCDAVYAPPARRGAECCSAAPGNDGGAAPPTPSVAVTFAGECARVLTYAMGTHAVRLASADVDACAEAITKATVGCDWVTLTLSVPIPPACEGILAGQLHEKAACRSSLECAAGLRCQGLSAIDLGVCGAPKPPGQECNLAIDTLASLTRQDHYARAHPECTGYCTGQRCQVPLAEGGACKADLQCGKLRCEGGKCTAAPLPGAGAPCSATCAAGLRCMGGKCAAPRAEGEACKTGVECRGACMPGDGGTDGTCEKTCTMQWSIPKPPKVPPPRPRR